MKRLLLALLVLGTGCAPEVANVPEQSAGVQSEPIPCAEEDRRRIDPCRVTLADITRVRGHDGREVQVRDGLLVRRDGQLLVLANDRPGAPFVVLDPAPAMAEWPTGVTINEYVDHMTRIHGRYTSADIHAPSVAGAAGTLSAEHMWLHDHLAPYVGKDDLRYPGGKSPYERACFPRGSEAEFCRYEISEVVQMGVRAPEGVQTIGFLRFVNGEPVLSECESWPAAAAWVRSRPAMARQLNKLDGNWIEVVGHYQSDQRGNRNPPNLLGWLTVESVVAANKPSLLSGYCEDADG